MMRKVIPLIVLMLIPALVLAAHTGPQAKNVKGECLPIIRGDEPITVPFVLPPYDWSWYTGLDETDLIGDTVSVGTTWYDNQHNGTIGRMIEKSEDGYMHMVWMKGFEASVAGPRHVFYNAIDPSGVQVWPGTGYQIDASSRAGFITMDTDFGGIAFPAFHEVPPAGDTNPHTAVAFDFGPHLGAFQAVEPDWLYENDLPMELIWPHMQFDRNQIMHVLSTEYVATAAWPQRQYYTPGVYDPLSYTITFPPLAPPDSSFRMIGWTMTIAGDVGTSEVSDRVAFAWTYSMDEGFPVPQVQFSQRNNNVYVLIDDDGLDFHFEDYFNLTQFYPPDPISYPNDTLLADMDTLRAYDDLSVFIDMNDYVHVVFTTPSFFALEGTTYWHASLVWHWSEEFPGQFQLIHNAFDDWWWNYIDCGAWNVKAQRPELGQDPTTGYLYCMYQVYDCDTLHQSAGGFPSGEIYVSVSTDNGQNWSVGTNVTNTITRTNASPGECLSELTPSLCKHVDENVHMLYVLDLDAGNIAQSEGQATLNPVIYHTVPVGLIPTEPLVPQYPEPGGIPFHVEHGPGVGIPGAARYEQPKVFALKQNYPNPFNPATAITFSLDQVSDITLDVFNLKGELVTNVASGTYGTGEHTITFDGSGLASGLYIYKLKAGNRSLENKMLLLK